jgi:hypothetical protein
VLRAGLSRILSFYLKSGCGKAVQNAFHGEARSVAL